MAGENQQDSLGKSSFTICVFRKRNRVTPITVVQVQHLLNLGGTAKLYTVSSLLMG